MDKLIVLSGVNMVEGGILTVYRTMIATFSSIPGIKLICLVHDKELFEEFTLLSNVEFREFSHVKSSWLNRLKFEYLTSYKLSKDLNPDAWICLHDISARVKTSKQFVYCHNPSPFYQSTLKDFKYDKTFYLFTKFYKFLYRINIKSNRYIIVQQEWIAEYFNKHFGVDSITVAHPVDNKNAVMGDQVAKEIKPGAKTLVYPAFPRTFKNFEVIIDAMDLIKKYDLGTYNELNIIFTFSKGMTKFGDHIIDECETRHLDKISFIGVQTKNKLNDIYKNESDALIFPSKLETWGLPLSEAKVHNLPILSAGLPYAKETIGTYHQVAFFEPDDAESLAKKLIAYCHGENIFSAEKFVDKSAYLLSPNWLALAKNIVNTLEIQR
ncbi:glycosyltransferase [Enterobacteriaceae bacterium C34A]